MIKINLLGVAPPPTAAAAPGAPASRTFQIVTFVAALVVGFLIVGLFWKVWSGSVAKLEQDLKREKAEQARLAGVKAENDRYQQQIRALEQRKTTIDMLVASRVGPAEQMTILGEVVNRTTDLYLISVAPAGGRLALRGLSGSVESMANFIAALAQSGYFSDVQLRQFFQDDQKSQKSYKFTLDCVYSPPAPGGTTAQPATPAGTAAPARRAGM